MSETAASARFGGSAYRRSSNFRKSGERKKKVPFTPTRTSAARTSSSNGNGTGSTSSKAVVTTPPPRRDISGSTSLTTSSNNSDHDDDDHVISSPTRSSVDSSFLENVLNASHEGVGMDNNASASNSSSYPLATPPRRISSKGDKPWRQQPKQQERFTSSPMDLEVEANATPDSVKKESRIGQICTDILNEGDDGNTNPFADESPKIKKNKTPKRTTSSSAKKDAPRTNPFADDDTTEKDSPTNPFAADPKERASTTKDASSNNPFAEKETSRSPKKGASSTNPFADTSSSETGNAKTNSPSNPFATTDPKRNSSRKAAATPTPLAADQLDAWLTPTKSSSKQAESSNRSSSTRQTKKNGSGEVTPETLMSSTPASAVSVSQLSSSREESPPMEKESSSAKRLVFSQGEAPPALDETSVASNSSMDAVAQDGWGLQDAVPQQQQDEQETASVASNSSLDAVAQDGWGERDERGAAKAAIFREDKDASEVDDDDDEGDDFQAVWRTAQAPVVPAWPSNTDLSTDRSLDSRDQLSSSSFGEQRSWRDYGSRRLGLARNPSVDSVSVDHSDALKEDAASVQSSMSQTSASISKSVVESSTYTRRKLYGGKFYQDPSECAAVLSMVESKRHCWFQNELAASQTEWNLYKKWLRDMVRESAVVEKLVRNSYEAFGGYSKTIGAICDDSYVNDDDELLTKNQRTKLQKRRKDASADSDPDALPLLGPLIVSFVELKKELEEHVPLMEDNVKDAAELNEEVAIKARELEEKGDALGWAPVYAAEEKIREAFDGLLRVAMSIENKEVVRDVEGEEAGAPMDRWLAEFQYRNAAQLGLLMWKENRRDYQKVYAEVIELDNYRQQRMKQILLSFLSKRRRLVGSAHGALMPGAVTLKAGMKSKKNEDNDIEKEMAKLLPPGPAQRPPSSDQVGKVSSSCDSEDPLGDDIFVSTYVADRRVFSLKVGKEWKPAVSVKTLDQYIHFFVAGDGAKESQSSTNPFEEGPVAVLDVTRSITSPVPEFSIKSTDEFDMKVKHDTVELLRTGRSKIFRKREDNIQIKFASVREASQWVESLRTDDDDFLGSRFDL